MVFLYIKEKKSVISHCYVVHLFFKKSYEAPSQHNTCAVQELAEDRLVLKSNITMQHAKKSTSNENINLKRFLSHCRPVKYRTVTVQLHLELIYRGEKNTQLNSFVVISHCRCEPGLYSVSYSIRQPDCVLLTNTHNYKSLSLALKLFIQNKIVFIFTSEELHSQTIIIFTQIHVDLFELCF